MLQRLFVAVQVASHKACRWILRIVTGKGELQRVCARKTSVALARRVAVSLHHSQHLNIKSKILFGSTPFAVKDVLGTIAGVENIPKNEVPKLGWCLEIMSSVNALHERVETLQRETFNANDTNHTELLNRLWNALKPEIRRTGPSDWSEIGFQNGAKPETDFRGMGMLGLHQLVYFAENESREARDVLMESCNPKRYFPFAATGVNITKFVVSLLEQRQLDFRLYEAISPLMNDTGGQSPNAESWPEDPTLMDAALVSFHRFFGESLLWWWRCRFTLSIVRSVLLEPSLETRRNSDCRLRDDLLPPALLLLGHECVNLTLVLSILFTLLLLLLLLICFLLLVFRKCCIGSKWLAMRRSRFVAWHMHGVKTVHVCLCPQVQV
ncbi:unnamed protein product [Choristocarpus tenellus]